MAGADARARWQDALIAADIFARDPAGLGGIVLRAGAGPVRDRWLAHLRERLGPDIPFRKVPVGASDEALLGGLDLAATLEAGRPVARAGLLAEADGGVLLIAMAERMDAGAAARIAAACDSGQIVRARDGIAGVDAARIGFVALDEGAGEEERPPAALAERAAFLIDLTEVSIRDLGGIEPVPPGELIDEDRAIEALCAAALALGIDSARAVVAALRVAQMSLGLPVIPAKAGIHDGGTVELKPNRTTDMDSRFRGNDGEVQGRRTIDESALALAVRLVLGPRATQVPAMEPEEAPPEEPDTPPPPPEDQPQQEGEDLSALTEIMIEAARAAIPADVLAALAAGGGRRSGPARGSGSGAKRKGVARGRPAGVRAGDPGRGARLSLVDTLRTAAPWQRLRQGTGGHAGIQVRRSDFRVKRYEERAETTVVFLVDASGSAALERLGETKGAVELMLAEAYVRRTQVALIVFRGAGAEILLPPTRSLARAKKCLADFAGGGGTPLAAGLEAGQLLAEAAIGRGRTPLIVAMTDGRANVGRDGLGGRERAEEEGLAAARRIRASGIASVVIDIATRPRPEAARLAQTMGARYAPLPRVEAQALADLVRT